jgi:hypothetical protein
VIVGSAVVRHLDRLADGTADREGVVADVGQFAAAMVAACAGAATPEA